MVPRQRCLLSADVDFYTLCWKYCWPLSFWWFVFVTISKVQQPRFAAGLKTESWEIRFIGCFLFVSCLWHSAGVGRTGCFIVIDGMTERIKHEKTVDVYGHVTLMRSQRNYMVQTEDQYIFIHDALLEAVTCGNTEVPARNLYSYIQRLTQIEPGENVTGMELEFKVSAARNSDATDLWYVWENGISLVSLRENFHDIGIKVP